MVQADIGNDAEHGGYYVGAVEPSAEPGLDDCHIHASCRKPVEGHHGRDLEKRKVEVVECAAPPPDKSCHFLFSNVLYSRASRTAVEDPHPFPEVEDMRRGVKPCLQTRSREHGSQHIGHRTFPVRPGDMYSGISPVRMAGQLVEKQHIVNPRFVGLCP